MMGTDKGRSHGRGDPRQVNDKGDLPRTVASPGAGIALRFEVAAALLLLEVFGLVLRGRGRPGGWGGAGDFGALLVVLVAADHGRQDQAREQQPRTASLRPHGSSPCCASIEVMTEHA